MGSDNHNIPASGEPRQQPSRLTIASSVDVDPAPVKYALAELGACLVLVAPSGMSNDDRSEWLKVAHMTLADVPADLMARGCAKARTTCRFTSEIVPCILNELEYALPQRRQMRADRDTPRSFAPPAKPLALPEPEYVDPAEISKLLASLAKGPQ